jgi:hypothetical protein
MIQVQGDWNKEASTNDEETISQPSPKRVNKWSDSLTFHDYDDDMI